MADLVKDFTEIEVEYQESEQTNEKSKVIKCGNNTDPNKLAYFIAREFENEATDHVEIQSIGPKALSKVILAIVRLQGIVAPYITGSTLVIRPSVRKLQMSNDEERTAIRLRLFPIPDKFLV